jgi:hypothetical protein
MEDDVPGVQPVRGLTHQISVSLDREGVSPARQRSRRCGQGADTRDSQSRNTDEPPQCAPSS